jgi:hypothetical protein
MITHMRSRISGSVAPALDMVADLLAAHLGRNDFLEHRENTAEAATFVRPSGGDELDAFDFRGKVPWAWKRTVRAAPMGARA